jgi:GDP-L-fucose synthase
MQGNVIHEAFLNEVKKMVFFASADVYPKNCPQPAREEYILTGPLEATCEPFALAKIAGIKMCESYNRQYGTGFITVIPPNIYGANQHYDIMNAQVLPSLIKKFHDAKIAGAYEVRIWGTGSPVRDFLNADDVADASLFLMGVDLTVDLINIGTGIGCTILELAEIVSKTVGYGEEIVFDRTKPDGVPKKLLDTSIINSLGWRCSTGLIDGISATYAAFLNEIEKKKVRTSNICHIDICERDTAAINNIRQNKSITLNDQPGTYKGRVVLKPWGHEYLIFENECVAVWFLFIKKGYSTSMHCHPRKKTSLIVLSGNAMSNTSLHRRYLRGDDAVIIEKGVFHSTKGLSEDGVFLLEIETPPDKTDLVRLEDRYGRASSGYEGITEMQAHNLEDFDCFCFEEADFYRKQTHANVRFNIVFEVFPDNAEFQKYFKIQEGTLYALCRGRLVDKDGNVVLNTGDAQKGDLLSNAGGVSISEKTVLLKITSRDK